MKSMRPPGPSPDFSGIDSREKAEALHVSGGLQKMLLFPERFGGKDIPENVVFVPPWVAQVKARIDETVIVPLLSGGMVERYEVQPEYQGKSFVPVALRITASEPGQFQERIAIWGEGPEESAAG